MKKKMKQTVGLGMGLILIAGLARFSSAQDGGVAAYLVMISNQGAQITHQLEQLAAMDDQITQSIASLQHFRDSALGQIGAIAAPIRELMALPTDLLDTARDWQNDFTGDAGELVGTLTDFRGGTSLSESWRDILTAADTVSESDIRTVYATQPEAGDRAATAYAARREAADRGIVLAHTRADAAAALVATARAAGEKIEALAAENNVSRTGLQQAVLAGTLTEGQLLAALAEMEAWDASTEAAADYDAEVARRGMEAARLARRTALEAEWAADRAAMVASRAARLESLYGGFGLHPFFGGVGQ